MDLGTKKRALVIGDGTNRFTVKNLLTALREQNFLASTAAARSKIMWGSIRRKRYDLTVICGRDVPDGYDEVLNALHVSGSPVDLGAVQVGSDLAAAIAEFKRTKTLNEVP